MAAISKALSYIQAHLDDALSPTMLANVACFSQHHFQRVFRAVVGESVMDHVRRLRLERAAYRLRTGHETVASIALDAGYGAQEAFTRIFQAYFGIAPRMFRYTHVPHMLPAPSGIHYSRSGYTPLRKAVEPELLDDRGLCPAHRNEPASGDEHLERLLGIVTRLHFPQMPRPPLNFLPNPACPEISEVDREIEELHAELDAARDRLAAARKRRPKERIQDYVLRDGQGNDVPLSALFAGKTDLLMIQNLGVDCIYCTVWADGIIGLMPHLTDRATLVLCSPEPPDVQKKITARKNWSFKTVSAEGSPFLHDTGFWKDDLPWPGVSVFRRERSGSVSRIGSIFLGAAEERALWPLLQILDADP